MAHDVFISYASGDKPVADAACAALESHGIRCWIAPRDVLPGLHYGEAIIDAIHECRIMVLVFSAKANLSSHIAKEIERGVSRGITIMPLRIEDVAPAKSLDYFIGGVHWLDALTPPLEAHLQRLAADVQTLLSRGDSAGNSTSDAQPNPANSRPPAQTVSAADHAVHRPARPTWAYLAISALTALVLVLGFLTYRSRSQGIEQVAQVNLNVPVPPPIQLPESAPEKGKKPITAINAIATSTAGAVTTTTVTTATSTPVAGGAGPATAASAYPTAARTVNVRREVSLHYIPESTVKLEQLIGDQDKERRQPTRTQTLSRFGVEGSELGASFEHQGHAYFLFGPSVGRLLHEPDTIAVTDTTDPHSGVRLDFLQDGGNAISVQPTGTTMALQDVPVAGISMGGQMYVAISTNFSKGHPSDKTVLTKFIAPATFQPVRTIAQLPGGRFIKMSMHSEPAAVPGLPDGGPFIFSWGTGRYRESDAYLSIIPAGQFETGQGARYFAGLDAAGKPSWSDNESDAVAIVKDGSLGDLSVTWCKDLGLWLMAYDRRSQPNGIVFSYSRTPWGPWSDPQLLFNPLRDNGLGKFIHNPLRRMDDGLAGPIMGARNRMNAEEVHGGAYAPYVVERWTRVQNSTLSLYYVMSTGNPYVVVLMQSRLQIE